MPSCKLRDEFMRKTRANRRLRLLFGGHESRSKSGNPPSRRFFQIHTTSDAGVLSHRTFSEYSRSLAKLIPVMFSRPDIHGCYQGQEATPLQENLRLQCEFSRRPFSFFVAEWRERTHRGSGKNFGARERRLAAPLVIFAQLGLVFFHLGFQLAEGFLAAGSHGGARAGGVQRCGGQR